MISERDDATLLDRFVSERCDVAFAELAGRYIDLVYSACARQLRDSNDAQDACQAVFIVLARKAASIRNRQALGAWLLTVARFAARDLRERKQGAAARERMAAELRPEALPDDTDCQDTLQSLDEALATLTERDRVVLVLRYFQGRSVRDTAAHLGISENATALATSRAVRRLRKRLTRHGSDGNSTALPAILLAHAVKPASAVVAASASLAASSPQTISVVPCQIAKGAMMRMLKTRVASVAKMCAISLIVASAGTWIVSYAAARGETSTGTSVIADFSASTNPTVTTGTAVPQTVLIKAVLTENNRVVTRPYVTLFSGQWATLITGTADHQFSITFTAGEADGDFRPVKIEAKNTLSNSDWSFTATPYFRAGETMSFKLSPVKDAPEQTLFITVKTANSSSKALK